MKIPARTIWLASALLLLGACTDPVIENSSLTALDQPSAAPVSLPGPVSSVAPRTGTGFLSGVISDGVTQRLLPGVTVRVGEKRVQTDQAGYYQFEQLEAGEVKLIAEAVGYLSQAITIEIQPRRQVRDLGLQPGSGGSLPPLESPPATAPLPTALPLPSASVPPIVLLPGGGVATPSPMVSASPLPSPTTSPAPNVTPTPSPTPSSLYDPVLDEAKLSELFLKRRSNGLELNFLLYKANGLPVDWQWGVVQVEYYLAQSVSTNGVTAPGNLITSGRSIIAKSNEPFVSTLNAEQMAVLGETIFANYTLTLPDKRKLSLQKEFRIN